MAYETDCGHGHPVRHLICVKEVGRPKGEKGGQHGIAQVQSHPRL